MITLRTPQTVTYLPNPQFGDSESPVHTVDFKKSMSNQRYSYVKSRAARRKLSLRFDLTLAKAFELMEFIRLYQSTQIILKDHLDQTWRGYITTNPNEVESQAKDVQHLGHGNIQIEFEGFEQ